MLHLFYLYMSLIVVNCVSHVSSYVVRHLFMLVICFNVYLTLVNSWFWELPQLHLKMEKIRIYAYIKLWHTYYLIDLNILWCLVFNVDQNHEWSDNVLHVIPMYFSKCDLFKPRDKWGNFVLQINRSLLCKFQVRSMF